MRIFGDDKYSGRRSSKKYQGNRSDNRMYDAVCDACGKDCKVPFKPTSGKPIYCSECFEKQGGGNKSSGRSYNRGGGRRDYGSRGGRKNTEMFSAICDDCGKECKVPFKPSSDKPIYCSECFEKRGGNDKGNGGSNSKQLEEINEKLDRILEMLEEN
jgi:CxxC-x17-CxxC domain-containing protein